MVMLGKFELNQIYTGDARELARGIPDESIDLIFTDPVYDRIDDYRWLAEIAARVLKPNSAALVWFAIGFLPAVLQAMLNGGLEYKWQSACYMPGLTMHYVKCRMFNNWRSLFIMGKGEPQAVGPVRDHVYDGNPAYIESLHSWMKGYIPTAHYITGFSDINAIIFDPFTGGGTVPAVCKMLGRNYIAFEIDPDVAERARERVRNTQPPLFVLQPEQTEMELSA